jgi:hypothetical protein
MRMKLGVVMVVALLAGCTHAPSRTALPASSPGASEQAGVVVVRGSVGLGHGTPSDAFLRTVHGRFTACRGWFINGASGGPLTIWELHLLTNDVKGLRAKAEALDGVERVTSATEAELSAPPVTGGVVTTSSCG